MMLIMLTRAEKLIRLEQKFSAILTRPYVYMYMSTEESPDSLLQLPEPILYLPTLYLPYSTESHLTNTVLMTPSHRSRGNLSTANQIDRLQKSSMNIVM